MVKLIGVLIGVALIAAGLYLGLYVMLIGGIIDIINQFKAPTVDAMVVAFAIAKIVLCKFVCGLFAALGIGVMGASI